MQTPIDKRLVEILRGPEQDVDLAEAALRIAQDEYPALDVDAYLHRLDALAAQARARLPAAASLEDALVTLNQFLFVEQGFSGNTDDYYDPRNSFLNEVLDRRLGIPITLSLVYMELGRRLGLPIDGISFPGHFLVRCPSDHGAIVLDPFSGGIPMNQEDLMSMLEESYGKEAAVRAPLERLLVAADKKEILVCMLRNLKNIYLHHQQLDKALAVVDRVIMIVPDHGDERRDRGQIYERLECFRAALEDYQCYLRLSPEAPDAADIHRRLVGLRQLAAHLN